MSRRHLGVLPGPRGFSLLEVLVALAIAGLALGAAFQGFAGAIAVTDRAAAVIATTRRAQALLAELGATARGPFELTGTTDDGFAWRAVLVSVAAHPRPTPPPVGRRAAGGQGGGGQGRPVLLRMELVVTPVGKAVPEVRLGSLLILIEQVADGR